MKKRIVAMLVFVLISTSLVFAESKAFYNIGASGSASSVLVYVGNSSSKGVSASASAYFSGGFENENYNFTFSEKVGLGGLYSSLSYSRFFKNAMFASIQLGVGGIPNYGFSFSGALGISLKGSNAIIENIGLAMDIGYQADTDAHTAMLIGMLGLVVEGTIPMTDSISLYCGMAVGSVPLFAKLFDKSTGDSIAIRYSGFSITLQTGIKYSFTADYDTTPKLNTR